MRVRVVVAMCVGMGLAGPGVAQGQVPLSALREAAGDHALMWSRLRTLTDDIGDRITGSAALNDAEAWALSELAKDGFDGQVAEPVTVHTWVRGREHVRVLGPDDRPLSVLALGNSAGTPDGPVVADVVVVSTLDELTALGDAVAGHIVLFDAPFTSYGETVAVRMAGPAMAASLGAVGVLVRSITPESLSTPHTGATRFPEGTAPIPAVAVTVEDAAWMHRVAAAGASVRVSVDLGAHRGPDAVAHNVVAERRGTDPNAKVVVLGCHLDSWDVGQGAQDDAAGCLTVWEAARLLATLPRPRRTLRLVLYTNEENGLAGGRAYAVEHADDRTLAAIEADTGAGASAGFRMSADGPDGASDDARIAAWTRALRPVSRALGSRGVFSPGYAGSDIHPLVDGGVMGFGVDNDLSEYWPIHHTTADTLEKIDRDVLADNAAATAVLAWWLLTARDPLLE